MYDIKQFPKRFKELRKNRYSEYKNQETTKYEYCKSQETFAEKIGVERRTIGRWEKLTENQNLEKGKNRQKYFPSVKYLIKISEALNCSIDYLLGSSDVPDYDPISKAHYYSKISPEIIRYAINHSEYLDFLNYIMLPDNISNIFDKVHFTTWKKYMVNCALSEFQEPLKSKIIKIFEEYVSVSLGNININEYKEILKSELCKTKLIMRNNTLKTVKYENCISNKLRFELSKERKFNYDLFIDYLAKTTFEPLSHNVFIEIQKSKIAEEFTKLFCRYIEEDYE